MYKKERVKKGRGKGKAKKWCMKNHKRKKGWENQCRKYISLARATNASISVARYLLRPQLGNQVTQAPTSQIHS
jgi:hypothetical protein